jgi:hypothetical protein
VPEITESNLNVTSNYIFHANLVCMGHRTFKRMMGRIPSRSYWTKDQSVRFMKKIFTGKRRGSFVHCHQKTT